MKIISYKVLPAIAAMLDYEIEQTDSTTTFLNGNRRYRFAEQPTGYEFGEDMVCRLNKALYGLKQSPRVWYETLSQFLNAQDMRNWVRTTTFSRKARTIFAVYVDDLLILDPP